jgi:hypothetical protein
MDLCAPALIYLAFSLTQIIIDMFKGLYNTAFLKFFVMIIITMLLNSLCQTGMGIISWIIVFIPFIFMSVIVTILLYVFGLDPKTGKLNINCANCDSKPNASNLIYSNAVTPQNQTAKYVDVSYSENNVDEHNSNIPTNWSSDPEYA